MTVKETISVMDELQLQLQDLSHNRINMLAAISHDLGALMTRIRLRMQLINENVHTGKITHDLQEMENMINSVLALARNDTIREKKIQFDINSMLQTLYEDYSDMGKPVYFSGAISRLPFFGSSSAIRRLFTNLIDNALKYAGEVCICLEKDLNNIFITLEDKGPGIPEHELDKVFQAYYRCERTRKDNSANTGLGLAIAEEIIRAHHGSIIIENRIPNGLKIKITFPYRIGMQIHHL